MARHVAILDDFTDSVRGLKCFELLSNFRVSVFTERISPGADLSDIEALIPIRERTELTRDFLARMPNLKVISQTGRAGNHIDLKACAERKIDVLSGIGSPSAPAELTWALILDASRKVSDQVQALKGGQWQRGLGRTVRGRTLGIWGLGNIGSLVAHFGQTFGMKVLIHGREASRLAAEKSGYAFAATPEALFAQSDVLSVHLKLSDATRGIVMPSLLKLMKSDALFVNTSRAGLVVPGALETALRDGRPGSAALDVFDIEPATRENSALLSMENVLATPHLGYVERDSYELYFESAFSNLVQYFQRADVK